MHILFVKYDYKENLSNPIVTISLIEHPQETTVEEHKLDFTDVESISQKIYELIKKYSTERNLVSVIMGADDLGFDVFVRVKELVMNSNDCTFPMDKIRGYRIKKH